jgi:hypothetical protein
MAWNSTQIKATAQWLDDTGLAWTLETIARHIAEHGDYGQDEGGLPTGSYVWPPNLLDYHKQG